MLRRPFRKHPQSVLPMAMLCELWDRSRSIRSIRSIRSSDAALDKSLVPKRQPFLSIGSHRWMAMEIRCSGSCGTEGAGLRGRGEGAGGGESGGGGGVATLPLAQTTLSHSPEQHQTPALLLRFATRCASTSSTR